MGRHADQRAKEPLGLVRPSNEDIKRQILSRIGKPVKFKYPGDEGELYGVLKDRLVVESDDSPSGIPYWDVVDLIEFPGTPKPVWMRLGYYRFAQGKLVWGSQTTLTEPLEIWRRIFQSAKNKPWFSRLLEDKDSSAH